MFLTNLFNFKKKCFHEKILPNIDSGYCPDCGKLIKNEWYVTRCACCGVKLRTVSRGDKITPLSHFCSNCGSPEYVIERLDNINFVDINFAVLQRKEVEEDVRVNITQCWQEKIDVPPKLLTQFL